MRKYKDIIPDYKDYVKAQVSQYKSFEGDFLKWAEGQKRCIKLLFGGISKDSSILDIACGDGTGLKVFRELGFENITGADLCDDKLERAKTVCDRVVKADIHDLHMFGDNEFDIVYSSHTLEHAYDPIKAIQELRRVATSRLIVVLPYGAVGEERAHGGAYELRLDRGISTIAVFEQQGLCCAYRVEDDFRGPEMWFDFRKIDVLCED